MFGLIGLLLLILTIATGYLLLRQMVKTKYQSAESTYQLSTDYQGKTVSFINDGYQYRAKSSDFKYEIEKWLKTAGKISSQETDPATFTQALTDNESRYLVQLESQADGTDLPLQDSNNIALNHFADLLEQRKIIMIIDQKTGLAIPQLTVKTNPTWIGGQASRDNDYFLPNGTEIWPDPELPPDMIIN